MQDNIDLDEIGKFEALAETWWDEEGDSKPLHAINPLRLAYVDERSPLAGKRVLDIGCGGGILSEAMAKAGAEVTGIDMGEAPLNVARSHAAGEGLTIDYQRSTAEAFAEKHAASFDIVTCMEMLEHVPDPGSVMQSCRQLVKPGGDVFVSTINRSAKAYLLAVVGAEYVLGLLPKGTHDYQKFIRPSELEQWSRDAGLKLQHLTGLHHNPLTGRYWVGEGVDVNYLMHLENPIER